MDPDHFILMASDEEDFPSAPPVSSHHHATTAIPQSLTRTPVELRSHSTQPPPQIFSSHASLRNQQTIAQHAHLPSFRLPLPQHSPPFPPTPTIHQVSCFSNSVNI